MHYVEEGDPGALALRLAVRALRLCCACAVPADGDAAEAAARADAGTRGEVVEVAAARMVDAAEE